MKRLLLAASYVGLGISTAIGLQMSGMTDPRKVIGFLDFFGTWDPTLIAVLAGATASFAIGYLIFRNKPQSVLGTELQINSRHEIDSQLVAGAAIFGAGWGLVGLCPGPAIAIAGLDPTALPFVVAMIVGLRLGAPGNSGERSRS